MDVQRPRQVFLNCDSRGISSRVDQCIFPYTSQTCPNVSLFMYNLTYDRRAIETRQSGRRSSRRLGSESLANLGDQSHSRLKIGPGGNAEEPPPSSSQSMTASDRPSSLHVRTPGMRCNVLTRAGLVCDAPMSSCTETNARSARQLRPWRATSKELTSSLTCRRIRGAARSRSAGLIPSGALR